jgi:hypothetical protein
MLSVTRLQSAPLYLQIRQSARGGGQSDAPVPRPQQEVRANGLIESTQPSIRDTLSSNTSITLERTRSLPCHSPQVRLDAFGKASYPAWCWGRGRRLILESKVPDLRFKHTSLAPHPSLSPPCSSRRGSTALCIHTLVQPDRGASRRHEAGFGRFAGASPRISCHMRRKPTGCHPRSAMARWCL